MDETTEREIIGDTVASMGGSLSGWVARRWLPLNVATADVRVALPPEQAVPASAQLLAAFGDIVEAEQGSFSALVCPGTMDNPVVVTFTLTPPAIDATEMVISVRAAAVEGLIKQRSAEALLPRVVAALEQLGSEPRSVTSNENQPTAPSLDSERLHLEPLAVEHADEMFAVLDEPDLHVFTGGRPATLKELRTRYERLVVGHSHDGSERWLNWVVRRRDDGSAVGTVQATVTKQDGTLTAEIAWVIGTGHQRQGFAREAALAMVGWLRDNGVTTVVAHVHPLHEASKAVARALGLTATDAVVDGEVRWQG